MGVHWKTTPADRAEMIRLYKCGVKQTVIARRFKVSKSYPRKLARDAEMAADKRPAGRIRRLGF